MIHLRATRLAIGLFFFGDGLMIGSWAGRIPAVQHHAGLSTARLGLALFAASLGALTSTQTFAYSSEAQSQCTGDAFRLCSSEIPNIPKITACMVKHRADLSVGCRGVMDRELAATKSGKLAAQ